MVRQGLYGAVDWNNTGSDMSIVHLDHCIDLIRQSLQCAADVTPITWIRSRKDGIARGQINMLHTCRNYEKIHQWALQHQTVVDWDPKTVVNNDPLGWGSYESDG